VELIEDYDCVIKYHPGKANVVADVLSRKNKMIDVELDDNDERELFELRKINAKVKVEPEGSLLAQLRVR
jgi:23S rRNA A2030 N6-methylase RlmJ